MKYFGFLLITLFLGLAQAGENTIDIPTTYNGIRCRTEKAGDFYMNLYRGQPDSMYWIANDRVTVLSTNLTAVGHLIYGHDRLGGTYTFDYDRSDFRHVDSRGTETLHHAGMNCVLCPADQMKCPGL